MAAAGAQGQNGLLIAAAVGVGGYLLFTKVIKPNVVEPIKTKAFVERLRIGKLQRLRIDKDMVTFDFPIENPNSYSMVVKAIVGDLYISDKTGKKSLRIGAINNYSNTVIKPTAATMFNLVAKIKQTNEFVYIAQVLAGKWIGAVITFKGTINANNRPWPVTKSLKIA